MYVSQFRHYEPLQTISLISMYCSVYDVSITSLELPSTRQKVSGVQLHSMFQNVQYKWLERATDKPWSADEFVQLCFNVAHWIEECPETCEIDAEFQYWWACMWKRGAEKLLGLRNAT